jgi:hypothetical protein
MDIAFRPIFFGPICRGLVRRFALSGGDALQHHFATKIDCLGYGNFFRIIKIPIIAKI